MVCGSAFQHLYKSLVWNKRQTVTQRDTQTDALVVPIVHFPLFDMKYTKKNTIDNNIFVYLPEQILTLISFSSGRTIRQTFTNHNLFPF